MASDLHQFLSMATMIQQFPLVVVRTPEDERNLEAELQKIGREASNISHLDELFAKESGLAIVKLEKSTVEEMTDIVSALRHVGTVERQGERKRFSDHLKLIFVLDEALLNDCSEDLHDRILVTFSPVYRSTNG